MAPMETARAHEEAYLKEITGKLRQRLSEAEQKLYASSKSLEQNKEYLWGNVRDIDGAEKASVRQSIAISGLSAETIQRERDQIKKLIPSPYFGRIDFAPNVGGKAAPVYIGLHPFADQQNTRNLIHDWRAPISGMFYDYELGKAGYRSPDGPIDGEITRKRQYRIEHGRLDFMLETSVSIQDDILQQELSSTTDEKMKNIVATIQREQNRVIRNDSASVLIIQGAAGSGKTSIALHRIAYLLYRHKDSISADDVMVISPNRVFGDYISRVLPELGEETVPEIDLEKVSSTHLGKAFSFESFFEQVTTLLDKPDDDYVRRLEYKSTVAFLKQLQAFLSHVEQNIFQPEDITVGTHTIPAKTVRERFDAHCTEPVLKRLSLVTADIVNRLRMLMIREKRKVSAGPVKSAISRMLKIKSLPALYKEFYSWSGRPEMLKIGKKRRLEYCDVFPVLYLKCKFEGVDRYGHVKHLVVDEMQDYTPVHYAVLKELFPCNKTILGDANQSVNPHSCSSSEIISSVFPDADSVILNKSYRSSIEIMDFAQKISPNENLIPIQRHGEPPQVVKCEDASQEVSFVSMLIKRFSQSEHRSLGIICRSRDEANWLFSELSGRYPEMHLLTPESKTFDTGITVTSAHMAKGLEFDEVVIPGVSDDEYFRDIDRGMLYVACTRALHRLTLLYVGSPSSFLI